MRLMDGISWDRYLIRFRTFPIVIAVSKRGPKPVYTCLIRHCPASTAAITRSIS